jgi:peptidyl-prolyl cis-trans isomerase B (cyclophilin B)
MKKILLVVLSLTFVFVLTGCKDDDEVEFVFEVPDSYNVNIQDLDYVDYLSLANPVVTIHVRDMGDIVIQLFPNVAPNTVNNFIKYIQDGVYEDNEFHRVINNFMIQAGRIGDPSCIIAGEMTNNDFENDLSHSPGVISMARLGGDYDSGSSQFFIVSYESTFLDDEYAAFGGVVHGFHIIYYISSLNDQEVNDVTIVPVYIDSIDIDLNGYVPIAPVCIVEEAD